MSMPRPEHPRPDFYREAWVNLNGEWQFAFDDQDVGRKQGWMQPGCALPMRILVPFCPQCAASGVGDTGRHPVLWYRRTFEAPKLSDGQRLLLRFGAVDDFCEVYVNGRLATTHRGGYAPFSADITDWLTDGANDLCVRVEDDRAADKPRGKQSWRGENFTCFYTEVSGIWQTVYLEVAGEIRLESVKVTPDIDRGMATFALALNRTPDAPVDATVTVLCDGAVLRRVTARLTQRTGRVAVDMVSEGLIVGFRFWTPDDPNLYEAVVELTGGDRVGTYFGMRSVEVVNGRVLLNHRQIYQRLILDQGYWPDTLLTPPDDDAIRADVEWTKKFGYNGARKHQKIEDPRYYYWADRLGLLVWEELPSAYAFSDRSVRGLSELLADAIERDFNHPSVICWVPLNESWGVDRIYADANMQSAARMLREEVRALDGTRLVSVNDGWETLDGDILGLHDYAPSGELLAKRFPNREDALSGASGARKPTVRGFHPDGQPAFLLTEYGGIAFTDDSDVSWGYHDKVPDEEAFFERFASQTGAVQAIPGCQGYVYTQLTDVMQEVNGLLTPDRKPKVDPEKVRRINLGTPR